jgi:hypothetical protein
VTTTTTARFIHVSILTTTTTSQGGIIIQTPNIINPHSTKCIIQDATGCLGLSPNLNKTALPPTSSVSFTKEDFSTGLSHNIRHRSSPTLLLAPFIIITAAEQPPPTFVPFHFKQWLLDTNNDGRMLVCTGSNGGCQITNMKAINTEAQFEYTLSWRPTRARVHHPRAIPSRLMAVPIVTYKSLHHS